MYLQNTKIVNLLLKYSFITNILNVKWRKKSKQSNISKYVIPHTKHMRPTGMFFRLLLNYHYTLINLANPEDITWVTSVLHIFILALRSLWGHFICIHSCYFFFYYISNIFSINVTLISRKLFKSEMYEK